MKIHQYNEMMRHLTRPGRKVTEEKAREELKLPKKTKLTGSKMLNWINYNNKVFGNNKMPLTEDELKIAEDVEKSLKKSSIDERTDSKQVKPDTKVTPKREKWHYTSWADGLEKRTRPEAKKILVAKKPKPTAIELLEFEDYLNTLDPQYWIPEEKPEDETKVKEIKTGIAKLI